MYSGDPKSDPLKFRMIRKLDIMEVGFQMLVTLENQMFLSGFQIEGTKSLPKIVQTIAKPD